MSADSLFNATPPFMPVSSSVTDRSINPSPFRIDEGYSEDMRTPTDSIMADGEDDMTMDHSGAPSSQQSITRQWLLSQPADFRSCKLKCKSIDYGG